MASTKKTSKTNHKPIRTEDDGPIDFFPKRSSGKRPTVPMVGGRGAQQKAAKAEANASKPGKSPKQATTRLSGLEAALQVLGEVRKAMTCDEIVTAILKRGLWKTDGKTPAATLNAAIHREIKTKGRAARFAKASRGKFVGAKGGK